MKRSFKLAVSALMAASLSIGQRVENISPMMDPAFTAHLLFTWMDTSSVEVAVIRAVNYTSSVQSQIRAGDFTDAVACVGLRFR